MPKDLTFNDKLVAIDIVIKKNANSQHIDAMHVSWEFKQRTGKRVDWHEFSDLLVRMCLAGVLVESYGKRYDGMVAYKLAEANSELVKKLWAFAIGLGRDDDGDDMMECCACGHRYSAVKDYKPDLTCPKCSSPDVGSAS